MNNKLKKSVAGIISTSMLLTSTMIVPTNTVSAETTINYGDALALSLYFFDAQQCGSEVDENCLTWRGDCHTYDETASLDSANGLGATEKAFIQQANGGSNTVDVSGGYHDAGDHIKFSMTMAFASTNLAWAYYQYPEAFEETGSKDHLFDILKEMCDYFMKVTYLDDNDDVVAFCYMVSDEGSDHGVWTSPEEQTMNRPTYWATKSNKSTDTACQMAAALASASIALKEVDQNYANECLKYANALQKFGTENFGATYEGLGSLYASDCQEDDVAWGDLWCNIANGTLDSYTPVPLTGKNDGSYNTPYGEKYDCWVYCWNKVWGGYANLLTQLGYTDYVGEIKLEMDKLVSDTSQAYYPVAGGWGASRYNCAWQMYAMNYANATGNDQYYEYAKGQMDYLLGNNPQNRSYLIGYTENSPVHIHHRAANPNQDTATYTLYGALVGGPTDANGSYDDNTNSYSCTEPALDYNGCFIMAIAGLYDKYGDGTDKIDSIISNASEINEDFEFGAWYESGNVEPIPTETTTIITDEVLDTTTGLIYGSHDNILELLILGDDGYDTVEFYIENASVIFDGNNQAGAEVEISYNVNTKEIIDYVIVNPPETTTIVTTVMTTIYTEETTTTTEETTTIISTTEIPPIDETTIEEVTTTTITDEPQINLGDVDDNGSVDANDVLLLKKYLLQMITADDINLNNSNLDSDEVGDVTANDLLLLKKVILQMITLDDLKK